MLNRFRNAVFVIALALSLSLQLFAESGLTPPDAGSLRLKEFSDRIAAAVSKNLDFSTGGGGTGELAREIRKIAEDFSDIGNDPSLPTPSFEDLRAYVLAMNGGHPAEVLVNDYSRAVELANQRLRRAGIDFVEAVQAPKARLIEGVRDFSEYLPKKKFTIADLKNFEVAILRDQNESELLDIAAESTDAAELGSRLSTLGQHSHEVETSRTIRVGLDGDDLTKANKKLEELGLAASGWKFETDTEAVGTLPATTTDFGNDAARFARWQKARLPTTMLISFFGAVLPVAYKHGIALRPEYLVAATGGLVAAGLEWQFGYKPLNNFWNKVWDRGGFAANLGVNWLYPSIVGLAMLGVEFATHTPHNDSIPSFIVKTMGIMTATFVASFGAAQIRLSRDNAEGESSNFKRYRFETLSCFWNGAGRVIGLGAAAMGFEYGRSIGRVNFGLGEAIGFGIQLSYVAAVTVPLWVKARWGRSAFDDATRDKFAAAGSSNASTSSSGWLAKTCRKTLAALANSNFYMLGRSPVVSSTK